MRTTILLVTVWALGSTACVTRPPSRGIPTRVWELFPFDGDRWWEYISSDAPYRLDAEIVGDPDRAGDVNVYNISYTIRCRQADDPDCPNDGDELMSMRWSSAASSGIRVYGYTHGDEMVQLRPPILVAPDQQIFGESEVTLSNGINWTWTTLGQSECPGRRSWSCVAFELTTDVDGGTPIDGTYYATGGQNIVAMDLNDGYQTWEYGSSGCDGECDGLW